MKPKSNFQITKDDYRLLEFLWRWKLSTTTILNLAIYKERSSNRCYRRLRALEKNKYIESIFSRDRVVCLWQLSDKGYLELSFDGAEMSQRGYKSEHPEHDFWSSLIHLGAWIDQIPSNTDLFSEQQLRRFEIDSYPKWVPHTKQHRPDGWWKTDLTQSNKESLIALEVEITRKPVSSYIDVGDFYSNVIDVYQVIWVVRSESDARFILKNLSLGSSSQAVEHSFILFSQFMKDQWQVPILIGKNKGLAIQATLNSKINNAESLTTKHCLLDVRKTPINSTCPRYLNQIELGISKNILS